MQQARRARTPVHLWIVGALATLWNAFGCYDYVMTRMRDTEYLRAMMPTVDPQAMLAWVDSFPFWAQAGWGLGVWGGLAGSILLLLRSRFAVPMLIVSLIGIVLTFTYQFTSSQPPAGADQGAGAIMPLVIIAVGIALLAYSARMRRKGVLR